jgi:hypothetical protein
MCCENINHHCKGHQGFQHSRSCGCGGGTTIGPCFWSKEEKIEWLEEHLENLQGEVKSIKERITTLKGEK